MEPFINWCQGNQYTNVILTKTITTTTPKTATRTRFTSSTLQLQVRLKLQLQIHLQLQLQLQIQLQLHLLLQIQLQLQLEYSYMLYISISVWVLPLSSAAYRMWTTSLSQMGPTRSQHSGDLSGATHPAYTKKAPYLGNKTVDQRFGANLKKHIFLHQICYFCNVF